MSDDNIWVERAQSWEAKYKALKEASEPAIERVKQFKSNFGIRERSDGSIAIDWAKFVPMLGPEQALALRREIDECYRISGAAGEKPKMRLAVAAQES